MGVTAVKGGRFTRPNIGNVTGPTSYANGTGQTIFANSFGLRGFSWVGCSMSVSGTYFVRFDPFSATPNAKAALRWFVTATGAEVGNAVNLSAETVIIRPIGG